MVLLLMLVTMSKIRWPPRNLGAFVVDAILDDVKVRWVVSRTTHP
jgi:hypothetical protein